MQRRSQEALTAMRQILRATENYARRLSRLTGLTASQLLLLQVLDQHGETTAGQIAAHMGITQATTTSLLHKLEDRGLVRRQRSEEHTSELQSLMRISYAVFCLKKKNNT